MEKLDTTQIRSPDLTRNILMVTQRSPFQDSISCGIDIHHISDFIILKIMDVSTHTVINRVHFDATIGVSVLSNTTSHKEQTRKRPDIALESENRYANI